MVAAIRSDELAEMLPVAFAGLIIIMVIAMVVFYFVKKQDDHKELIRREVKILEKPVQQGSVEWYVVECENGERIKLRSFQANTMIISVGDEGTIEYRGSTIQAFHRKK